MERRNGPVIEFLDAAERWLGRTDAMSEEEASILAALSKSMLDKQGLKASRTAVVQDVAQRLRGIAYGLKPTADSEAEIYTQRLESLRSAADSAELLLTRIQTGSNIRRLRLSEGMNLTQLADRADIDIGYASKLENFGAGPPSLEVAARLARVLSVETTDLWDGYPRLLDSTVDAEDRPRTEQEAIISEIADLCGHLSIEQLRFLAIAIKAVADAERQHRKGRKPSDWNLGNVFA